MSATQLFTLLPPYYDKSPYDDIRTCLKLIEEEFGIKIRKYYYDKYAFGNDVFVINDQYVFRFPRTYQTKDHLKYEINLLKFLQSKVSLQIPHYVYVSRNKDFGGYKIITGENLTPEKFRILSKRNKIKIIDELIRFVNDFHSITLTDFVMFKPGKPDDFALVEKRIDKDIKTKLFPKLPERDVRVITDFYKDSRRYFNNIPSICPTHGDLYQWNIIWDKTSTSIGVIDFSDYLITDPARDFEVFFDYGPESVLQAYNLYTGQKDPEFLKRSEIYYKLHGIYTLLSSQLGANISFDYAYEYFFKAKFDLY